MILLHFIFNELKKKKLQKTDNVKKSFFFQCLHLLPIKVHSKYLISIGKPLQNIINIT